MSKKWSTELVNCHVRCSRCRQQLSLFFDQHRHRIMHERRRFVGTANVITFFKNSGRDGWSQFKFLFGERPSLADVILSVCNICKINSIYDMFSDINVIDTNLQFSEGKYFSVIINRP